MIFTVQQLQEKCREKNLPLYVAFFNLTKAFGFINWEALWSVLLCYGSTMNDMDVVVMTNGSTTDQFPVQTIVKQGYATIPTPFSIYLAAMPHLTTDKL
eukprot:g31308.t1